jgi:hypothetical protein
MSETNWELIADGLMLALLRMRERRHIHIDDMDLIFGAVRNYYTGRTGNASPFVDDRKVLLIAKDGLLMAELMQDWHGVRVVIEQIEMVVNHRV